MLALFGNISGLEIGVIMMLAVLIFGSRLPEVASRVYTQFRRMREAIERFRRDTGIDHEMREIQRNVRDTSWRKQIGINLQAPEQQVMERSDIGMPAQNVPKRSVKAAESAADDNSERDLSEECERTKDVGMRDSEPSNDDSDAPNP